MSNTLLVYEEIPERTVILWLNDADLEAANITPSEIESIHSVYAGTVGTTKKEEKILAAVYEAVLGPWNEAKQDNDPALWAAKIVFKSGEEEDRAATPPRIGDFATGDFKVIHTGIML